MREMRFMPDTEEDFRMRDFRTILIQKNGIQGL